MFDKKRAVLAVLLLWLRKPTGIISGRINLSSNYCLNSKRAWNTQGSSIMQCMFESLVRSCVWALLL